MHVETARGTGPGGQHRNTRDTAVRAWHEDYPEIVITRNSGRSQAVNVDGALAELAERIAALRHSAAMAAVNAQRRAQAEPVTPGTPCGPLERGKRAGRSLPRPGAGAARHTLLAVTTTTGYSPKAALTSSTVGGSAPSAA